MDGLTLHLLLVLYVEIVFIIDVLVLRMLMEKAGWVRIYEILPPEPL